MKLNKILTSIATAAVVATPVTWLTSCNFNKGDDGTSDAHIQYIYNRTFSLMAAGSEYVSFGTGWIIDDATKDNNDDYCYWIATNWHVIHGNETVGATRFFYADNSLKGSEAFIEQSRYKEFGSGCFTLEDKSNFLYSKQEQTEFLESAIDFYVVKADFGNPTGKIKSKLDDLNKFRKENGYINKFVKDSSSVRSKTKYIAGYPMKENAWKQSGGQWEYHTIKGNSLDYYQLNTEYYGSATTGLPQKGHAIGNPNKDQQGATLTGEDVESFYYYDISPNYMSNINVGTNWMTGGASGSMLLTEDYEICGIYWGGWSGDNMFFPSFSLFYNDAGDFVSKYTK